jgi:enoyl-CoA hydratase/carnithine racemase
MKKSPTVIRFSASEGIAEIIFNRPDQLNAMNRQLMDDLIAALEEVHARQDIRVAILTGAGKAFMAGADIKDYARQSEEEFEAFQNRGRTIYSLIEGNAKPVIAAVNGYTFGGGMEIALACDMVLAVEDAQFGLPEIKLALIPGGGGTQRLARKTSLNFAKELLLTGRTVDSRELFNRGFINRICPADTLLEESRELAASLVKRPVAQLQMLKQLVEMSMGPSSESAYRLEMAALGQFYRTPEAREKIEAFFKRSQDKDQARHD